MYISHFLSIVFFFSYFTCNRVISTKCTTMNPKRMSKTKCVAGRRFFARLDNIPSLAATFSKNTLVRPYIHPWIVKISLKYHQQQGVCTGTLINDRYVITVQRCVLPPVQPQNIIVTLGYPIEPEIVTQSLEKFSPNFLQLRPLEIIPYPGFLVTDVRTASNDVALLKIPEVKYYSKTIYPVQLPTMADKYYDLTNKVAENVGWKLRQGGNVEFDANPVKIINNMVCRNFNVHYRQAISSEVLCTVNSKQKSQESCSDNPGTALTMENDKSIYNTTVLIGILSWDSSGGKSCVGNPVVHVRIDNKLDWIKEKTRDAFYCRY